MTPEEALKLLELGPDATPDDVKQAYLRLIAQWHPDKNTGATEAVRNFAEQRAKDINAAKDVLLNGRVDQDRSESSQAGSESSRTTSADDLLQQISVAAMVGHWGGVAILALQLADFPGYEQRARKFLAQACIQTGQAETAASAAKAAVDHDRSDHEAWYLLAGAHAGQNQWRFAVNEIRKAISLVNPLPAPYRQLRDFVYEQRVNGMPLKARLKKIAAGECPVCSTVGAFKNNVCGECGYKSEVDGIAQGVTSYFKQAWESATAEDGKTRPAPTSGSNTRSANACPVCGFSYGYRDGTCKHCTNQIPRRISDEARSGPQLTLKELSKLAGHSHDWVKSPRLWACVLLIGARLALIGVLLSPVPAPDWASTWWGILLLPFTCLATIAGGVDGGTFGLVLSIGGIAADATIALWLVVSFFVSD